MTQAVSEDMTYVPQECLRYMRQLMECKTVLWMHAQLPAFSLSMTVLASALQTILHEHAWSMQWPSRAKLPTLHLAACCVQLPKALGLANLSLHCLQGAELPSYMRDMLRVGSALELSLP